MLPVSLLHLEALSDWLRRRACRGGDDEAAIDLRLERHIDLCTIHIAMHCHVTGSEL